MHKQDEALRFFERLAFSTCLQNERSALTLLALTNVGPKKSWAKAEKPLLRWIAQTPDHMIHYNGPKFVGPYKR